MLRVFRLSRSVSTMGTRILGGTGLWPGLVPGSSYANTGFFSTASPLSHHGWWLSFCSHPVEHRDPGSPALLSSSI